MNKLPKTDSQKPFSRRYSLKEIWKYLDKKYPDEKKAKIS
jgi:hypothetical protein